MDTQEKNRWQFAAGLSIAALFFIDRAVILWRLNGRWMDDDQAVLWVAVSEMLRGRFHQPHFFGQAYNIPIEQYLAVPLAAVGVPLDFALPLSAAALSLLPFMLLARLFRRAGRGLNVIVMLTYLLMLPLPYVFLSGMPRGFSGGIALAAVSIFLLMTSSGSRPRAFPAGLLCIPACSINPNAGLFLLPVLCFLFMEMDAGRRAALPQFAAGVAAGAVFPLILALFYLLNPDLDRFGLRGLGLSLPLFVEGLRNLDNHFSLFSPFRLNSLIGSFLPVAACAAYAYVKGQKRTAAFFLSVVLLSFAALSLKKVHDGSLEISYHYARSFLGFPVLVAFGICLFPADHFSAPLQRIVVFGCVVAALVAVVVHGADIGNFEESLRSSRPEFVRIQNIEAVKNECRELADISREHSPEILIFLPGGLSRSLSYVCPLFEKDLPPTLFASFDRRRWRVAEERGVTRRKFLLYKAKGKILSAEGEASSGNFQKIREKPGIQILTHPGITARRLILDLIRKERV